MSQERGGPSLINARLHLGGASFPASTEDLLLRARERGAGQDMLEVLEFFPKDKEFKNLADVMTMYGKFDQAPQTGVIDIKP